MAEPARPAVEALITQAAQAVPVPDPDVFAARVTQRLRSPQPAPLRRRAPRRHAPRWQLSALAAGVAALCILGASLIPPVRSAVAGLLGVDGVRIKLANPATVPTTPSPSSTPTTAPVDPLAALHLGELTTLQLAARRVGFAMRIPTIAGYQHPDAVYVGTPPPGGMASMIYLPAAGRPAANGSGVAALLSEFRGHLESGFFEKLAGSGTTVEAVPVGRAAGYWLSGAPHEFFYTNADGTVDTESIRLAANTLLWSTGGITYRLEGTLSRDAAVALANSMR
jgi:hypothetical protein